MWDAYLCGLFNEIIHQTQKNLLNFLFINYIIFFLCIFLLYKTLIPKKLTRQRIEAYTTRYEI